MTDIRQRSVTALVSALPSRQDEPAAAESLAQRIEQAVYDAHNGDTGNAYRSQLRSISLDLGKNNVELAQQLLAGRVNVEQLVSQGSEGMRSAERIREDEELREQGLRESISSSMNPTAESAGPAQGPTAENEVGQEGEEGDLKARGQPKIAGLQGIEFDSGL